MPNKIEETKKEKEYQVWKDYGSENWQLNEFNSFTECVDFMKTDRGGCSFKITKAIKEDSYYNK